MFLSEKNSKSSKTGITAEKHGEKWKNAVHEKNPCRSVNLRHESLHQP
jgi:hypothetical protein